PGRPRPPGVPWGARSGGGGPPDATRGTCRASGIGRDVQAAGPPADPAIWTPHPGATLMARWVVAAFVIFAAACGRQQIETEPAPRTGPGVGAEAPPGHVLPRTPRTAAQIADSAAEAELLDSLQQLEPGSLPELTLEDINEPRWDINVERFATHPRVQYYLDFFTGRGRKAFQVWLDRMPRFESYARMRLQEQGIPSDLVYLALIESGFSPVAVSRAKAVGMWQFMPATGRGYGLRIDT